MGIASVTKVEGQNTMRDLKDWHKEAVQLNKLGYSSRQIARALGKGKSSVNDLLSKLDGSFYGWKAESVAAIPEKKKGPRVLVLDIETKYLTLHGFQLFNQNFSVDQIQEDISLLSFAAKWIEDEEVMYYDVSVHTELELLQKLHVLLNEAHFVIAHNGRRFDMKKIRAFMLTYGLPPHSPVRVLDTLEICKKEFGFSSNKLVALTRKLCKTEKSDHGKFAGFLLWREFCKGNPEAIQEMRDYNIVDVTSLQELYEIIAPWSTLLPVFEVYEDEIADMTHWVKDGFIYSNLGKYDQYRNTKTGQYRRGQKNLLSKEKKESLLRNIV